MRIGFDYHGVLETYPEIFKPLMLSLMGEHEVIVISGPPKEEIDKSLSEDGYVVGTHYNGRISVVDWLKARNVSMHLNKNGSWYCDESDWWASKAEICRESNVKILFDDSLKYKEFIDPKNTLFLHVP